MQKQEMIIEERITKAIYLIRDQKVMVDSELAELYGVSTKRLNEQVKRNSDRFPDDFMFQLTMEEWNNLKSQFATSRSDESNSHWGGRRTPPFMFTEQGVAMLSSVLNSHGFMASTLTGLRTPSGLNKQKNEKVQMTKIESGGFTCL